MKKQLVFIIIFFAVSINCIAQFSKTHYLPPLSNSSFVAVGEQFIYISCPSITPINFQLKEIGGATINGTVSRNNPYVYNVSSNNPNQLVFNESGAGIVHNDAGYIVEAQDIVYVSVRVRSQNKFQATEVISKGLAGLGTHFRIGGFINTLTGSYTNLMYTFASILATENNTTISFSDIKTGAVLVNNASVGNTPPNIILNAGESYVIAVQGPTNANKDALIGALISSDKPIVVNCGSMGGTNGENSGNMDYGVDQIVSAERTGTDYIFIKSNGQDNVERVLLVADTDNTQIFVNGATTPNYTLNHGEYICLTGNSYNSQGNMYIHTNNNVFAYQSIGDDSQPNQADQEMFFVPPLSCQTPKSIDNIPFIDELGPDVFPIGRVSITTKVGSPLTFIINSIPYTLASLPSGVTVTGPSSVTGNTQYECYTISGLTGNVSVFSTTELYLTAYGIDGAATFGGYYSGFTFKPQISFQELNVTQSSCIPNINLAVSALSGFDTFQWYFNNTPIPGAITNTYTPSQPGNYSVYATLSACGITLVSDNIPVSTCPTDIDNDGVNDNIDLDNNNDGITNCYESYGNQNINISNPASGSVAIGTFNDTFTGIITTSTSTSPVPFTGSNDGSFISDVAAGKTNWVQYEMTFAQPISLSMEYITTANASDLLNPDAQYVISCPINKTITVLNPNNQLLIDTNFDGIYETGVTNYSAFEIRFQLNGSTPLAAGAGTFKFQTHLATTLSFKHQNLLDTTNNRVSFKFIATCVPNDTDGDGTQDQLDLDNDNDGIPDSVESHGGMNIVVSTIDNNQDGIYDAYGSGITPVDSDGDGIPDYLDLDSDNDGIYDLVESGSTAVDANNDGIIDGGPTTFGSNGLSLSIETAPNNGLINYTLADTDADGTLNYIDLDSDNDLCSDVIEAGFTDSNHDGMLGTTTPPTTTSAGVVTSGTGYSTPNSDYTIAAPIAITTQPANTTMCEQNNATFTIASSSVDSYQWQVSTDNGTTWNNVTNNATYSGATTITLTVTNVTVAMSGYQYRVFLNKIGNACGLYSTTGILNIYALPVVNSPISLKQCDDNTDGISDFNLTEKNNFISANYLNETFTYFTTFTGADTNDITVKINNPIVYTSGNGTVWARVENANGCYRIAQINLIVSVTQLTALNVQHDFHKCDDYIDAAHDDQDGITKFDFSYETTLIQSFLIPPYSNYTIKYYESQADALAEINAIPDPSNYRNSTPNVQTIYVRVDSNLDDACFGLGPFVTLTVEKVPNIYAVNSNNIIRHCDDDQDGIYGFNTTGIEASIIGSQTGVAVIYTNQSGTVLSSPLPNPFYVTTSQTLNIKVINTTTQDPNGACYRTATLQFIVDVLPQATAISSNSLIKCDNDEIDPMFQNGLYPFNTSAFTSTILNGQTGMSVNYFDAAGAPLNPLQNPFNTASQTITAQVVNNLNNTCPVTVQIPFVVHPVPKIYRNGNELVCSNFPNFTVTPDAGITDGTATNAYTYQWYLNGAAIPGATAYTHTISTAGVYTVYVTNIYGCPSTRTITVTASNIAQINSINIVDLTDLNSVEVIATGPGNYVYALDDESVGYQTSNIFENVPMGIHTVFIKDLNGCGVVQQQISVLGIPKYFTPNGDGFNDTWNIEGVNSKFYPQTTVYIFDRFGKLIQKLTPSSNGWDGTYNGQELISDDYWYLVKLDDGRTAKGHFTLKR
ncbi:T9SS type B sorting domain-containing protein [Flavobacterium sp. SUN046]|uniref:T9SS type B sorting domain-containing protein n=1 Tax=Flavobacterium sp. SUN046 TaxID=3002440 RepID=UPI002DBE9BED|nr:T9SS type B sorting domain-containing protein [Flavobacterium sp. SUN046]MEC4049873.1 T9SS type B sorting domain-containing protein [Flavobacterium sp. SUN046]